MCKYSIQEDVYQNVNGLSVLGFGVTLYIKIFYVLP